ncbi:MAG TPA: OsmC family protein [Spirochaetales bacterium]|nr:OsmC family protein [Spirochaetales bacterium]
MAVIMTGKTITSTSMELVHQSGAKILVTAPKDNGGDGSSFSPTDLCATSLGACGCLIMSMFAANKNIPVRSISFELKKEMAASPRRIERITVAYSIDSDCSDLDLRKIEAAGRTCPVRVTLGDRVDIVDSYARA